MGNPIVRLEAAVDDLTKAYRNLSWLGLEDPYDSELSHARLDIMSAQSKVLDILQRLELR